MRPHPERDDRLSAEHALGTLAGPARRRFDARLAAEPALRARLAEWRERLLGLTLAAPTLAEPSPAVWQAIERRLFGDAAASASRAASTTTAAAAPAATARAPRGSWWTSLGLWRAWSAAASAAAVLLLVAPWRAAPPPPTLASGVPVIVVLQADPKADASLAASFVASLSPDGTALVLRPLPGSAAPSGRAWQLWGLPAQGAPRSLGLVASDAPTTLVGADAAAALGAIGALAVSVEPPGGSPTGQPTGPVIAVGRLEAAPGPGRTPSPSPSLSSSPRT